MLNPKQRLRLKQKQRVLVARLVALQNYQLKLHRDLASVESALDSRSKRHLAPPRPAKDDTRRRSSLGFTDIGPPNVAAAKPVLTFTVRPSRQLRKMKSVDVSPLPWIRHRRSLRRQTSCTW
jgi:hypothetical protein